MTAASHLPPHLAAEAEAAIAAIESATNRMEKVAAIEGGRRIKQRLDDYWASVAAKDAMTKALARPQPLEKLR